MLAYIVRRLLLVVPTLIGIMVVNFVIVQVAPGGPVEQLIAEVQGTAVSSTARFTGSQGDAAPGARSAGDGSGEGGSRYRGARGLDPAFIKEIETLYGFDKPMHERFLKMMGDYLVFDFGNSFFRDRPVVQLVIDKLPVSISIGIWSTLIIYFVSIPLGIRKAVRDGTRFDYWTSTAIIVAYAAPGFLLATLLIVLFAGGGFVQWFPLRGLVSEGWAALPWYDQILDYLWHMVLPIASIVIGGFVGLTMLTKNSFLDQINQQYVLTARAKGLTEKRVLYGHVFRNAMIIVIAGFPGMLIGILFTGAFLIEIIFSLDGLGLLGWEALIQRDYPMMFGTLYFFTLLGLVMAILRDVTYVFVDPRIDFEARR
jgi:microcin C transport system permease protein